MTKSNPNNAHRKHKKHKPIYLSIYLWMTIEIYILPHPRGVEFSGEEVIVLPLASMQASSKDELRSQQPFERMYVNNIYCDSSPFTIYFAANISSWLNG